MEAPRSIVEVPNSGSPLAFRPLNLNRDYRFVNASFALLKPGLSLDQARAQMDSIGKQIATDYPDSNRGWGIAVERTRT